MAEWVYDGEVGSTFLPASDCQLVPWAPPVYFKGEVVLMFLSGELSIKRVAGDLKNFAVQQGLR